MFLTECTIGVYVIIIYDIIFRLGRPHSFVVRRSINNARRPTRCGGSDDTDDGYNDDDDGEGNGGGCEDDDDYYNCSLLLQNKPKMRSCRRWSQADSLALATAPRLADTLTTTNSFRIGGPVSCTFSSSPDDVIGGGRTRFGGQSSLQVYTPTSTTFSQLPSLPPRLSPPPLPPPPSSLTSPLLKPPPPPPPQDAMTADATCVRRAPLPLHTTADLPAIPESSQWDDHCRRRRIPPLSSDRLERNGSTRVSGRNAYRTFNRRTASPAATATVGVTTSATHCRLDNQV